MRVVSILVLAAGIVAFLLLAACAGPAKGPPVRTVTSVDLSRYTGLWYEIARYPNRFQEGCRDSSATYTLRPDGEIDVVNRCRRGADGNVAEARGRAWPVDPADTTRLKVSFFWPFRGDYWIIDLGENYEYAVVGTPDRNYLWILARQPKLSDDVYTGILRRVQLQGFEPERLRR